MHLLMISFFARIALSVRLGCGGGVCLRLCRHSSQWLRMKLHILTASSCNELNLCQNSLVWVHIVSAIFLQTPLVLQKNCPVGLNIQEEEPSGRTVQRMRQRRYDFSTNRQEQPPETYIVARNTNRRRFC